MEIYLIRHAQSENYDGKYYDYEKRTMNPPLTPLGADQAQRLAERLRGTAFDRIISSDLDRAIQTALPLTAAHNIALTKTAAFREIDMGEVALNGWSAFPDIEKKWLAHDSDIPYPGGESGLDVWMRCKQEIDAVFLTGATRVAIVTHGGTTRATVCGALGLPQQYRFRLGAPITNCSITILDWRAEGVTLHALNERI